MTYDTLFLWHRKGEKSGMLLCKYGQNLRGLTGFSIQKIFDFVFQSTKKYVTLLRIESI